MIAFCLNKSIRPPGGVCENFIHPHLPTILLIPFLDNYIPFATFVKYLKFVIWAIAALV